MDLGTTVMLSVLAAVIAFGLFVAHNIMKAAGEGQRASRLRDPDRDSQAPARAGPG